jgi:hypothetical protein
MHDAKTLMQAVLSDHLAVVQYLLSDDRLSVHVRDKQGLTALLCAAKYGRLDVVQWLLEEGGANPFDCDAVSGQTPMLIAAAFGHWDVVEWLIRQEWATSTEQNKAHLTVYGLFEAVPRSVPKSLVRLLLFLDGDPPEWSCLHKLHPVLLASARGSRYLLPQWRDSQVECIAGSDLGRRTRVSICRLVAKLASPGVDEFFALTVPGPPRVCKRRRRSEENDDDHDDDCHPLRWY